MTTKEKPTDNKKTEISHEEFLLNDGRSILNFLAAGASSCGYCDNRSKNKQQSSSRGQSGNDSDDSDDSNQGRKCYNMITFKLNSNDYQALLDRGWRRSGTLCYYPINTQTCCPNYSIICKALEFQFTRSKRKCIQNLNNFLMTGLYCSESKKNESENEFPKLYYEKQQQQTELTNVKSRFDKKSFNELKGSTKAKDKRFVKSCERKMRLYNVSIEEAIKRTRERPGRGRMMKSSLEGYLYPHKSILYNRTKSSTTTETKSDNIVDEEKEQMKTFKPKHKLEIRLNHVDSEESMSMREAEHQVLIKYQEAVHNESESHWTFHRFVDFLVDSPLFVEPIEPEKYDYIEKVDGKLEDTYSKKVYDYDESEYLLVKPPQLPTAYGTYHCTYHLDGELIACGVLDVLPKCITTVYFFYDPKYSKLNLGYYSALVEISMVRQMAKHFLGDKKDNKLTDYYIGFYVHECKKMHYKTRFEPSYLLCSETAQYEPTRECLKKLAQGKKYVRFSSKEVPNAFEFKPTMQEISKIPISVNLFGNSSLNIVDYFQWLQKNLGPEYVPAIVDNYLEPYARLVGRDLLPKIILQINSVHKGLLHRYLLVTDKSQKQDKK